MKKRILILCTGNACRSQMAEGIIKNLHDDYEVFSAGTFPAERISQYAVRVMKEIGIDISSQYPKNVSQFLSKSFDYVITVCDDAKESCPVFSGEVKERLHFSIEDPTWFVGTEEEKLEAHRKTRDEIKEIFGKLLGTGGL